MLLMHFSCSSSYCDQISVLLRLFWWSNVLRYHLECETNLVLILDWNFLKGSLFYDSEYFHNSHSRHVSVMGHDIEMYLLFHDHLELSLHSYFVYMVASVYVFLYRYLGPSIYIISSPVLCACKIKIYVIFLPEGLMNMALTLIPPEGACVLRCWVVFFCFI